MLDEAKASLLEEIVAAHWPESIDTAQIGDPALAAQVRKARDALLHALGITELA